MILAGITIGFVVGDEAPSAEEALNGTPIPSEDGEDTLTLTVPVNGGTEGRETAILENYEGVLRVSGFPEALGTVHVLVSGTYDGSGSLLLLAS